MGPISFALGERIVQPANRKSRALLAYLVTCDASEESRERLVGLLWSETPENKARGSLRQAIREIRVTFEPTQFAGFYTTKLVVGLDRSKVEVDLWDVIAAASEGRPHQILLDEERPFERLLADFETIDTEFRLWLLAKRQSLADRTTRRLEAAMRASGSDTSNKISLARALMNLDPTHEEAARTLIVGLANDGDLGGAFRVYRKLWNLLEEEYDVEPSRETQDLIAHLRLEQPPPKQAVSGQALPAPSALGPGLLLAIPSSIDVADGGPPAFLQGQKLVINLAPFESSTVPPQQRYFVDGFRRELIACMVRFREWLISDGTPSPSAPSNRANARGAYIIETSVFPDGEGLRLALTLRETATGIYLWSERLHLSTANWTQAQQLVIRRLTSALNVHLSAGHLNKLVSGPGEDVLAYDQWLRGQAFLFDWSPSSWHKAAEIFRDIIRKSPNFGPAYSSLTQLHNNIHFVHPGVFRDSRRTANAITFGREATRLDPVDSRAHLSLGWAYATAHQHASATLHHDIAFDLNDNDPWTVISAGLGSAFRGHLDRARALADSSLDLAPMPTPAHWRYQAMIRYLCDQHEESVAAANRAGKFVPNILVWKAAALVRLDRRKEAEAVIRTFFDTVSERWFGERPPTKSDMSRWILSAFPIEQSAIWERLRGDLGHAGAPIEGITYLEGP